MARFYENDRNTPPRPPRPTPPGDVARRPQRPMSAPMPSTPRGGGVSKEESKSRLRDAQFLMPRPQPRTPMPMPPGLEGQQFLAPGGMGGRMPGIDFIRNMMGGDQGNEMPLPRNFDPMTEALLRAYMRQMQDGQ